MTSLATLDRDPSPTDDAAHILIVDDDARIRSLLARFLGREGFRVTTATDPADARTRMTALAFDLLIVDVMMPGETGFDFVAWLRSAVADDIPVLMLTARSDASDRINGLEAGADDYLAKPFEPRELALRVRSILRRVRARPPQEAQPDGAVRRIKLGDFAYDLERGELRGRHGPVRLTEREGDILRILAQARGAPLSRNALATPFGANERTIDVQVTRLRRKIEADPAIPLHLQTVRGVGYRLVADVIESGP